MLLFTCARDSNFADIKKYGLRQSGMGHRLLRSYDEATKECAGKLLAVDLSEGELGECKFRNNVVVAPAVRLQSFRNLNPYLQIQPVTAAGGVLVRRCGKDLEVLMIHRRGVWDLPKGKVDPGESIPECALREVREELGIRSAEIISPLDETVHGYPYEERYLLKTTHWFLMRTDATRFKPDTAEDIDRVKWMLWKDARERAGFDTLSDLLKDARAVAMKKA